MAIEQQNKHFFEFLDGLPSAEKYKCTCPNCKDKILLEENWRQLWYCEFCDYTTRTRPRRVIQSGPISIQLQEEPCTMYKVPH